MNYAYNFSLKLFFDNSSDPLIISKAISPDLSSRHSKRSASKIAVKKNLLSINIDSADAVALRATANSLLKKIILAKSILEVK